MGKLFYLIGKSSTGKDTIFQSLLEREDLGLKPLVLYTTRPMRAGETPGVQYHFTDEAGLSRLQAAGKVIELRAYQTVHGIWKYFTAATPALERGISMGFMVLPAIVILAGALLLALGYRLKQED